MGKAYGLLQNRFEEGRNYNEDKLIHVGDDITMYYWSDRTCYYVTEVINQKDIKVKKYHVVASRDPKNPGGLGTQNWEYFKSENKKNEYLNKYLDVFKEKYPTDLPDDNEEEWVFRYNKWKQKLVYTKEDLDSKNMFGQPLRDTYFTDKEVKKLEDGGEVYRYIDLSGKISFGVKEFYYDWEF